MSFTPGQSVIYNDGTDAPQTGTFMGYPQETALMAYSYGQMSIFNSSTDPSNPVILFVPTDELTAA